MGFFRPPAVATARTLPTLPITSNLALRLDASVFSSLYDATSGGSVVADGGTVARWEDQSGNGRHATQGTANNRPVFRKYFGDIGGVYFDGVNDVLSGDLFSSAPNSETILYIGLVSSGPSGANGRIFTQKPPTGDDFSSTGHYIPLLLTGNKLQLCSYAGAGERSSGNINANSILLAAIHTGSSLKTRINGTNNAAYNHTIATGDKYSKYDIGALAGNSYASLLVFEILVYSTSLTDSEVGQLEDYAKDKLRWYF